MTEQERFHELIAREIYGHEARTLTPDQRQHVVSAAKRISDYLHIGWTRRGRRTLDLDCSIYPNS